MGLSLDGYAKNAGGGNSTGGTVTFSNTNAGDLVEIVVFAEANGKAGSPFSITSLTSPSLTWTRRKQFQSTLNGGSFIEKWYAVASGVLTNEVITFTFNATMDDYAAYARGWSGADTVTPYDTNASLPVTNSNNTNSAPTDSGCSTTAANAVITSDVGSGNFGNTFVVPSGFTTCGASASTPNGTLGAEASGAYQIETSAQTSLTITWGNSLTNWLAIVDAVRAAPAPSGNRSQSVSVGF